MNLTRRDALAALAGAGIVASGAAAVVSRDDLDADPAALDTTLETLVAAAEVVYPTEVEGVREFVEAYSLGRMADRPDYREGVDEATDTLDGYATSWHDAAFASLSVAERDSLLREMGVDAVEPDPAGIDPERVRYFVVNELQYALYTSPTGGKLVGIENPQGYPGGTTSYQRGPEG